MTSWAQWVRHLVLLMRIGTCITTLATLACWNPSWILVPIIQFTSRMLQLKQPRCDLEIPHFKNSPQMGIRWMGCILFVFLRLTITSCFWWSPCVINMSLYQCGSTTNAYRLWTCETVTPGNLMHSACRLYSLVHDETYRDLRCSSNPRYPREYFHYVHPNPSRRHHKIHKLALSWYSYFVHGLRPRSSAWLQATSFQEELANFLKQIMAL